MDSSEALTVKWYVQPEDLIGGWCIMTTDYPPSENKGHYIADFIRKEDAEYIVELHNKNLTRAGN